MEELSGYLKNSGVEYEAVEKFEGLVVLEEFESDSVKLDVTEYKHDGNISKHVENKHFMDSILSCFAAAQCLFFFVFVLFLFILYIYLSI